MDFMAGVVGEIERRVEMRRGIPLRCVAPYGQWTYRAVPVAMAKTIIVERSSEDIIVASAVVELGELMLK